MKLLELRQPARKLEQVERRLDVVLDKGHRRVDRVVDVRLGRDVEDDLDRLGASIS